MLGAQSCPTLCEPMDCGAPRVLCPWDSPGKNAGMGCHFLLQGIFPTQGSNSNLLHLLHGLAGSVPLTPPEKPLLQEMWVNPWVRKMPWRRKWQPTPVFLPGKSNGQGKPGGLQSMEVSIVGHDLATKPLTTTM